MKLCRCGKLVVDRCQRCYPVTHGRTTTQRGYGYRHRRASERLRANERPLCEMCVMQGGVVGARVSEQLHHIYKIVDFPQYKDDHRFHLALCLQHHEEIENDIKAGLECKEWCDRNYEQALMATQ